MDNSSFVSEENLEEALNKLDRSILLSVREEMGQIRTAWQDPAGIAFQRRLEACLDNLESARTLLTEAMEAGALIKRSDD